MKNNRYSVMQLSVAVLSGLLFLSSCNKDVVAPSGSTAQSTNPVIPKNPPTMVVPTDNPMSDAKAELGRHLFYDKVLSVDGSTACGTCHQIGLGFSDKLPVSVGFEKQHGTRNAPALGNVGYNTSFTWDGRFNSLEAHVPGPIFNSVEMGNNLSPTAVKGDSSNSYSSSPGTNDTNLLFKRISGRSGDKNGVTYATLFTNAWGNTTIGLDRIAKSIAAFERTFVTTQSTFDRYNNGDESAYKNNPSALHGFQLFTDANGANCVSCHSGYNFTDQQFHDNGIGMTSEQDQGRYNIQKVSSNIGKFKTPSLRNVALSAPYMHDGRFATLQDVLHHYNSGGTNSQNQDPKVRKLSLSEADMADIIAFLQTLSDDGFVTDKANKFSNPWNE